jgi:NitT/TauT family transport system permease protein
MERVLLGLLSVVGLVVFYALASNAYRFLDPSAFPEPIQRLLRPDVLPPPQRLLDAFVDLVSAPPQEAGDAHAHGSHDAAHPAEGKVTLYGSLLVSTGRVLLGLLVGVPLGVLVGLAMGWSRRVDDWVHPIFVLFRSIPPLALIAYVMLWLGHGEARLLIPIAYAVFTTLVIPTYHGVRDIAAVQVAAARSLGAGNALLFSRVVLPAAAPFVLSGVRYALVIGWMTTVGAEMLMGEEGIGALLASGGLWASRFAIRVDPAVVMVGIAGLSLVAYAMDGAVRMLSHRVTRWMRRQPR